VALGSEARRTFFVIGHTQSADPKAIRLEDLPGASGRWDVLARCVASALLLSHGVRQDSEVVLYLVQARMYVRIEGAHVRNLNPDERSTAALMSKALLARPVGAHEENPHPGVFVGQGELNDVAARIAAGRPVVVLDEQGKEGDACPASALYVLSDHKDFAPHELAAFDALGASHLSLGSEILQADQAIVLVHDRILRHVAKKEK
jgi:tRNA (pseudouridine54-N1)-methyltransferase